MKNGLNGLDGILIEGGFTALTARPCGNVIQAQMNALAIYIERSETAFQFALTANAFHRLSFRRPPYSMAEDFSSFVEASISFQS